MSILEVRPDTPAHYCIDILLDGGVWRRFTEKPLRTEADAVAHAKMMTECIGGLTEERVRVREYKMKEWLDDLIEWLVHVDNREALVFVLSGFAACDLADRIRESFPIPANKEK